MGNAVAGGSHHGWWYRLKDFPDGPSFTTSYCVKNIPMGKFYNNSVHSNGRFGLWIFPMYHPTVSGSCSDTRSAPAVFDTFYSYLNSKGAEWVESNPIQFKNFVVFDHSQTGIEAKTIIGNQDYNSNYKNTFYSSAGPLIQNAIVIGNSDSSSSQSVSESGIIVAWDRGELLENVSFYNFPSRNSRAIRGTTITCRCV